MRGSQPRGMGFIYVRNAPKCPEEEREVSEQEEEIFQYLRQSHILKKNMARLKALAGSSKQQIAQYAALVYETARIKSFEGLYTHALFFDRSHLRTLN
jgi:hypothetical protein